MRGKDKYGRTSTWRSNSLLTNRGSQYPPTLGVKHFSQAIFNIRIRDLITVVEYIIDV